MAHRINERNSGHWSIDGEPKRRSAKQRQPGIIASAEEKELVMGLLEKVFESMAFDAEVSERGHLRPEAKFTDGGRREFLVNPSGQVEMLRPSDLPLIIGNINPVDANKFCVCGEIITGKRAAIRRLYDIWRKKVTA